MAPDIFPALTQPSPAGFMHILYVGIMLPAAVLRRRLKASPHAQSEFNRSRYFRSAALGLAFLTGFSWLVAFKEHLQLEADSIRWTCRGQRAREV